MTRRRKPFRRPPDGPTRDRSDEHPSFSDLVSDEDAADPLNESVPDRATEPLRERQTAEHQFGSHELAPRPFPASFSKAANVPVDPALHAQLHTASPDRSDTGAGTDDNPLIMMLRDHPESSPSDDLNVGGDQDRAAQDQAAQHDDDFDLRWRLELPPAAGNLEDADDSADFAFGDTGQHTLGNRGDRPGSYPGAGYAAADYPAADYPATSYPAAQLPAPQRSSVEQPPIEQPPIEQPPTWHADDGQASDHDDGDRGFVEDDRALSYASDAAAQIDFLRSEIRRYQGDLERERLARTTAITRAQLAADARVEDLIRSQRHEQEQLDLINRKLLDAQRSEAEARRSALIEEHRRQRAKEHQQYQERVAELRESTRNINQAATERFENEYVEAHETRIKALQSQLEEATERAEQLETENREFRTNQQTWEQQIADAESSLSTAQARQRDTSAQLTHQVQELQERLARAEQRLNGERKRTSELVGNLLRESAAVASQARNADQEITSLRASWADERDAVVAATLAEARAIERAAAEREAHLEATIGQLRAALHGVDSSIRGA